MRYQLYVGDSIDFLANYDFGEVFMGGSVNVGVSATYTINYKFQDFEVGGVVVQPGYDAVALLNYQLSATSLPEWKGSAFVEYSLDRHNLRFTLNREPDNRRAKVRSRLPRARNLPVPIRSPPSESHAGL